MFDSKADSSLETRRRLLDAAAEVFAEVGFADATVRRICEKAGANVAAVNYHFGDKQKLYAAVFEHTRLQIMDHHAGHPGDLTPEDRLRFFIRQFLKQLLSPGHISCHAKLVAQEMGEPSGVLDTFIDAEVRPRVEILTNIIRQIAGELPPRVLAKCGASVVAQTLHYHWAKPVLKRIGPIYASLDQNVEELVDHVTRFSLGGIRAIAERYQKSPKGSSHETK
jgi:AcrR family transcriptional regulator